MQFIVGYGLMQHNYFNLCIIISFTSGLYFKKFSNLENQGQTCSSLRFYDYRDYLLTSRPDLIYWVPGINTKHKYFRSIGYHNIIQKVKHFIWLKQLREFTGF